MKCNFNVHFNVSSFSSYSLSYLSSIFCWSIIVCNFIRFGFESVTKCWWTGKRCRRFDLVISIWLFVMWFSIECDGRISNLIEKFKKIKMEGKSISATTEEICRIMLFLETEFECFLPLATVSTIGALRIRVRKSFVAVTLLLAMHIRSSWNKSEVNGLTHTG